MLSGYYIEQNYMQNIVSNKGIQQQIHDKAISLFVCQLLDHAEEIKIEDDIIELRVKMTREFLKNVKQNNHLRIRE